MRIAYVEDEPDIRELTGIALRTVGGLTVQSYTCASDALANLPAHPPPDLFLLDVMMPDMDGRTLLRRLRDLAQFSAIPAIFMTAKSMPAEVQELLELGAIAVIPKPFDPMTLADEIRANFAGHKARSAIAAG